MDRGAEAIDRDARLPYECVVRANVAPRVRVRVRVRRTRARRLSSAAAVILFGCGGVAAVRRGARVRVCVRSCTRVRVYECTCVCALSRCSARALDSPRFDPHD